MFEELEKLAGITSLIRLLHLRPEPLTKDVQAIALEKARLLQVRLDLESELEARSWQSSRRQ
jgi:hypothetical protein